LGLITAVIFKKHPLPLAMSIALAAAALGAARYNLGYQAIDQDHIASLNGIKNIVVSGLIIKPPDIYEEYQNLTVKVEKVTLEDGSAPPVQGVLKVRAPRSPIIDYGTRIQAVGQLEAAANFGAFDYQSYLAHRGIYSTMNMPSITLVETGAGNPLKHGLLAIHKRAQESINKLLPQPQAALLSGILLGDDHALPEDLEEDFRSTGMTHIIAISGFNIALIAGALLAGGRQVVGIRIAAWIAIAAVFTYTIFVGAEASVVRAAVMATLMIFAVTMLGRPTYLPAVIFSAAFFLTLLNPDILWDVGFQLSFASTLGLTLYLGPWSHHFQTLVQPVAGDNAARTATRFVSEVVLATFAAMIVTFPLIIYHFRTISLVSPLANLLILPAQPGIMTWGGLATAAGMISPILGQVPAWIAWLFLSYTIALVEFFGSLTFAAFPLTVPPIVLAGGYGIIFAASVIGRSASEGGETKGRIDGRVLKASLIGLLIFLLLAAAWLWQRPDGKLHVSFLDVGQGDAILIESPDGRQMLVDGGQYPSLLLSRVGEQLPFWDKSIDLVVATHPDADHVAGLVDLFESYEVGQVITNGSHAESGTGYFGLVSAVQQANTPIQGVVGGEVIALGSDVRIEILHAGALPGSDEENDESIVMRLVYGDFSLLLTGDAEQTAEMALLNSGKEVQSAVLKAGHHGSNSSSCAEFLQAVHPQIVVISGADERYDHPHEDVLARIAETGATVMRTDELGTIELISDGELIWSNVAYNALDLP
jgi:competence protein ComEC